MEKVSFDQTHVSSKEKRLGLLLWYYLSRFFNHSVRLSNKHLNKWKLSTAQFDILVQTGANEQLTQKELGDKLLVTKGNITQLLVKMENDGLIRREREWKTKYISLTDKGKALYQEVVPQQEAFQAAQFDALSHMEQQQLLYLLKKLHQGTNTKEE